MHFYTGQHRFYCGVDLHTRTLSLCVLDQAGGVALEATLPPEQDRFLQVLAPFRIRDSSTLNPRPPGGLPLPPRLLDKESHEWVRRLGRYPSP